MRAKTPEPPPQPQFNLLFCFEILYFSLKCMEPLPFCFDRVAHPPASVSLVLPLQVHAPHLFPYSP